MKIDNKKTNNKNKKEIDILKLREELLNIDVSKIISEALSTENKYSSSESKINNLKTNDILSQTKKNAILNFVLDLDLKNKNEIKEKFIKEIDKIKYNAELELNRKEKISSEYISKYNQLLEENKLLKQKLNDSHLKYNDLEIHYKNSQNQIIQMKMESGLFENNKKLFEEFINHFPNDDPIEIMKGYEQRHLSSINVIKENEELKLKIKNLTKQNQKDNEDNSKHINKLYNKIDTLTKEKNEIIENFEIKISKLNNQIMKIQSLEEKNKLLHKMLYQLYNKLIESLRLDKNLRIDDEYLNIKEQDFKPNIFDDIELGKYIKLMIATTKPQIGNKLLRETIAYSNMILRNYLKNRVNLRFDPVNTFKELKSIMEEKEDKIKNLSDLVKKYEFELNNQDNKNKKLSNIIKHIKNINFNKINNKYLESARGSSSARVLNKRKDKKNINNNNLGIKYDETINTKLFSEENKSNDDGKTSCFLTDSKKIINTYKTNSNKNNNRRSHKDINTKKQNNYSPDADNDNNKAIKYRLLSASLKQINNEKNNKLKTNYKDKGNLKLKFYKDPLYQSLYCMNKDHVLYRKSISETNIHSNIDDKNLINKKSEKIMNIF